MTPQEKIQRALNDSKNCQIRQHKIIIEEYRKLAKKARKKGNTIDALDYDLQGQKHMVKLLHLHPESVIYKK